MPDWTDDPSPRVEAPRRRRSVGQWIVLLIVWIVGLLMWVLYFAFLVMVLFRIFS